MKRIHVALVLAVVLVLALGAPALAYGPGEMPEAAIGGLSTAIDKMPFAPPPPDNFPYGQPGTG